MTFMILASRHHSMFRRPSCLILLRLSRFFAIYTTDIQVFEFECTADKSRVLVKQQVEIKTAETRTFCMFKVWLQRENSYESVISLRTLMSWARACWFAKSFLEQLEQSNNVAIALHFEERPLTKSALHVGMRSVYHMATVNFDAIIPTFCSEFPNQICNFSFYFVFFKVFNLFFINIFWS